ncbi:hypothetical protein LTR35_017556 [Friedmanniomyces endolithicus]|nr:hypothetical protein LTR35_017556 [Friedmanniomyces endolithicus]KAK0268216.1 hypothetical protein LTS00_017626 [Friedmanniomyces endolithicus]KAK0972850.1 hypothetical protein LTR54_017475 [Friedmanniomyces endolithicus]
MPPVRTRMASIKPMKTERTHEENQERAFIAASRRNDRSLEARVESARRASETHKRRTGRSLRVTEQDVINEEMYEEEDDDLPMQYRRLTAHLQTQNADFSQRLQSYVINQMAMRQAVSNAAIDGMLMNNGQVKPLPLMNINPGNMTQVQQQQQQFGFQQGSMMPPQMYNRTPSNYRQQPYPIPQHNMQPSYHSDALSVANAQSLSQSEQQQSQSGQTSPVETKPTADNRRMSLPVYSATAFSQWGQVPSPSHGSPDVSRTGSSSSTVTPAAYIQQSNSYQQVPTPPETKPQQRQESRGYPQQQDLTSSPFAPSFEQQLNGSVNPFTLTLPMEAQPMLAGSSSLDPRMSMMFSPQNYSYNPNGKPRNNNTNYHYPIDSAGRNQTLMVPPFDTNLIACDTVTGSFMTSPQYADMADPTATYTPSSTPQWGYGMGFDSGYRSDIFKTSSSSEGSGNATPQEADFGAMLNIPAEALGPDEGVLA